MDSWFMGGGGRRLLGGRGSVSPWIEKACEQKYNANDNKDGAETADRTLGGPSANHVTVGAKFLDSGSVRSVKLSPGRPKAQQDTQHKGEYA